MSALMHRGDSTEAPRAVRVVHDIPGRLRLRLPPGASTAGLEDLLEQLSGAHSSVWSPRTRSLLIHYDPSVLTPAQIAQTVADHADLAAPPASGDSRAEDRQAPVATSVMDTFSGL